MVPSALPPTLRKNREGRGSHCVVVSAEGWASPPSHALRADVSYSWRTVATPAEAPTPEIRAEELLLDIKNKVEWLDVTEEELEQWDAFQYTADRDVWREVKALRSKEHDEHRLESARLRFQNVICENVTFDWLRKNTALKSELDFRKIVATVQLYLQDEQRQELAEYLRDVLTVGLKKADKKRKKALVGRSYWAIVGWAVLTGLIRVAFVVAIFSAANTKFETIVFAMLILIYAGTQCTSRLQGYLDLLTRVRTEYLLKRILLRLKYEELKWVHDDRIEEERKMNKNLSRAEIPIAITDLSFGLVWLIAMGMIVTAIFF